MDQIKIGQFIAEKRRKANMTQVQLAEKLSISDKAVSKWERGICCPDISLLVPLSEMLDTSVHSILKGEEVNEKESFNVTEHDSFIVESIQIYSKDINRKTKTKYFFISIIATILIIVCLFFYTEMSTSKYNPDTQLAFSYFENNLQDLSLKLTELDQSDGQISTTMYIELKTITQKSIQSNTFLIATLAYGEPIYRLAADCNTKLSELEKNISNISPPVRISKDTCNDFKYLHDNLCEILTELKKKL